MTSKHSRKRLLDRYVSTEDFRQLDNDIREEPKVPPSVGIFDSPYRCYIVNEEWDAHIAGAISALAEWRAWVDDTDERSFAVQQVLKLLGSDGDCTMTIDCNDVETCLETSDIINAIQATLDDHTVSLSDIISDIDQIQDELTAPDTNEYPPPPTLSQASVLCDVSYYVTDKLIGFIEDVIDDASTITLEEFLIALLGIGGFDASLLKLLWDFVVANTYPDLLTDIQASRDEVAEYFYCNELDKDAVIASIDASLTIGEEAQAGLIGALNSIEDSKLSLWITVGQFVDSGETCGGFCDGPEITFFSNGFGFDSRWVSQVGVYNAGEDDWDSSPSGGNQQALGYVQLPAGAVVTRVELDWKVVNSTGTRTQFISNGGVPDSGWSIIQSVVAGGSTEGTLIWTGSQTFLNDHIGFAATATGGSSKAQIEAIRIYHD